MQENKVLVVATKDLELTGVDLRKTIEGVDWLDYNYLVFHSWEDSDTKIVAELTKIRQLGINVVYINEDVQPLWYSIFSGLNADIYSDMTLLNDQSVFDYIIENHGKNKDMTVKAPTEGAESLEKIMELFENSDSDELVKFVNNKLLIKTLSSAVTTTHANLMKSNEIGNEVLSLMGKMSELISSLEEQQLNTAMEFGELQKMFVDLKNDVTSKASNTGYNLPQIYNKYTVPMSVSKGLYIRVYGNCQHLNSFFVAYQHYLKMQKQLNSKILLVYPKQKLVLKRYKDFSQLSMESIKLTTSHANPLCVTFEPKKAILDAWFKQNPNTDLYIVIDYLQDDPLLDGHNVYTMHGITSVSDLKRYGIKEKDKVLIGMSGTKDMYLIPFIKDYRTATDSSKLALYYSNCKNHFERLDKVLFKK